MNVKFVTHPQVVKIVKVVSISIKINACLAKRCVKHVMDHRIVNVNRATQDTILHQLTPIFVKNRVQ